MAEYVYVYHDIDEKNRSTWHRYEDVGSLVRGVLQDDERKLWWISIMMGGR